MRLLRASNQCGICGDPIEKMHDASIDHIVPLSKGGLNNPKNMQLAHEWCNRAKGDSMPGTEE